MQVSSAPGFRAKSESPERALTVALTALRTEEMVLPREAARRGRRAAGPVHALPPLRPCLLPPRSFSLLSVSLWLSLSVSASLSISFHLSPSVSSCFMPSPSSLSLWFSLCFSLYLPHSLTTTTPPPSVLSLCGSVSLLSVSSPSLLPSLEADLCDHAKPRGKVRAPCRDRYRLSLTCHLCLWQRNSGAQERQGTAVTGKGTSSWG